VHWRELVPHNPDRLIGGMAAFADHLALTTYEGGLATLHILRLAPGPDGAPTVVDQHAVQFPEPVYTYRLARNAVYATPTLHLVYMSLTTPATVYGYDMDARRFDLIKRDEVIGYNPDDYITERLWATAPDGVQVPISLVRRKDVVRNGANPAWLYSYGSYGANVNPAFDANRISLLDRGFVFALAHIRGGSELGRSWYDNGKLLHKRNSFTDFIACAEHLVAEGYTRPDRLVISGRSAGGLLMGAVTNLRPDLFAAVIAGVPFMDVINTMLDPTLPLTVTEFEEWGNPESEESYRYMLGYSPYDQLAAKDYPHLLVTAGLHDPRVAYWEPAKYVAKLRTLKTDDNLLLLKTNMDAGHGGATGRYDRLRETAFEYTFFLEALARSIA
jgi:oligopeptidase B